MKKITSYLIIMIILFNFIFCNSTYAMEPDIESDIKGSGLSEIGPDSISGEQQSSLVKSGIAPDGNKKISVALSELGKITQNAVVGSITAAANTLPLALQILMMSVAYDGNESTDKKMVTIEDMVFGEIDVLSINFFDESNSDMIKSFRKSISQWFYTIRLIAAAIGLLALIYIGIRMALSVTSSDKAKYKEMFIGWVESMLLLFVLHYIIAIFLHFGGVFTNVIDEMKNGLDTTSFESVIMNKISSYLSGSIGWDFFTYSIIFWILIFIQGKFFLSYSKRLVTVGFLIVISPLVTVIYAIDKAGDGKAQSFDNWMKEFGINVFIQPIEALIYIVFMGIANELASESILLGIIFMMLFTRIEKIMLQIFNVKGMSLHIPHN